MIENITDDFGAEYALFGLILISVPDDVTAYTIKQGTLIIDSHAFSCCSALQSIVIPEGVTVIENGAFSYCSALQSVVIPESVTKIGEHAFCGCLSLKEVKIPRNTKVADNAFENCPLLN